MCGLTLSRMMIVSFCHNQILHSCHTEWQDPCSCSSLNATPSSPPAGDDDHSEGMDISFSGQNLVGDLCEAGD